MHICRGIDSCQHSIGDLSGLVGCRSIGTQAKYDDSFVCKHRSGQKIDCRVHSRLGGQLGLLPVCHAPGHAAFDAHGLHKGHDDGREDDEDEEGGYEGGGRPGSLRDAATQTEWSRPGLQS